MDTSTPDSSDGKAYRIKKTFRLEYSVIRNIKAGPERIWSILTDAPGYSQWNSTIQSMEGPMTSGEKIKLRSTVDPSRTFSPTVSEVVPEKKMVWQDGAAPLFKGVRTYTLIPLSDGTTDFSMKEVFTGLMLPLIAPKLPDFRASFEQFAKDLQQEAERKKTVKDQ
jgi:hypothetical protein